MISYYESREKKNIFVQILVFQVKIFVLMSKFVHILVL